MTIKPMIGDTVEVKRTVIINRGPGAKTDIEWFKATITYIDDAKVHVRFSDGTEQAFVRRSGSVRMPWPQNARNY
jgi:hypothetical protein